MQNCVRAQIERPLTFVTVAVYRGWRWARQFARLANRRAVNIVAPARGALSRADERGAQPRSRMEIVFRVEENLGQIFETTFVLGSRIGLHRPCFIGASLTVFGITASARCAHLSAQERRRCVANAIPRRRAMTAVVQFVGAALGYGSVSRTRKKNASRDNCKFCVAALGALHRDARPSF